MVHRFTHTWPIKFRYGIFRHLFFLLFDHLLELVCAIETTGYFWAYALDVKHSEFTKLSHLIAAHGLNISSNITKRSQSS